MWEDDDHDESRVWTRKELPAPVCLSQVWSGEAFIAELSLETPSLFWAEAQSARIRKQMKASRVPVGESPWWANHGRQSPWWATLGQGTGRQVTYKYPFSAAACLKRWLPQIPLQGPETDQVTIFGLEGCLCADVRVRLPVQWVDHQQLPTGGISLHPTSDLSSRQNLHNQSTTLMGKPDWSTRWVFF